MASKKVKSNLMRGLMSAFILVLMVLGFVVGCTNSITNVETFENPPVLRTTAKLDQYWFVEEDPKNDTGDLLAQYLKAQGDDIDLVALEEFITQYIGDLVIILDEKEAEELEKSLLAVVKDKTVITHADGTKTIIIRFSR